VGSSALRAAQASLFAGAVPLAAEPPPAAHLCQWFTPSWLSQALVERHFGDLSDQDFVVEPTCGNGSFLTCIPAHVPALGVEIDARQAEIAARESGRQVIVGDFLAVQMPRQPTAFIGNPPFRAAFIDQFLSRCHALLPEAGRAGFLLPAYALQTSRRVAALREQWSMNVEIIPRDVFPRLRETLLFALFTKDRWRRLVGVAFVDEAADVLDLPLAYRRILQSANGSRYRALCAAALRRLGGRGSLQQIYAELERARPSRTAFWKDGIRRTLREYEQDFIAVDVGHFSLRQTECTDPSTTMV
jgi:hypothetical protein